MHLGISSSIGKPTSIIQRWSEIDNLSRQPTDEAQLAEVEDEPLVRLRRLLARVLLHDRHVVGLRDDVVLELHVVRGARPRVPVKPKLQQGRISFWPANKRVSPTV